MLTTVSGSPYTLTWIGSTITAATTFTETGPSTTKTTSQTAGGLIWTLPTLPVGFPNPPPGPPPGLPDPVGGIIDPHVPGCIFGCGPPGLGGGGGGGGGFPCLIGCGGGGGVGVVVVVVEKVVTLTQILPNRSLPITTLATRNRRKANLAGPTQHPRAQARHSPHARKWCRSHPRQPLPQHLALPLPDAVVPQRQHSLQPVPLLAVFSVALAVLGVAVLVNRRANVINH